MDQTDQLQELVFSACKNVQLCKVYSRIQERFRTGGAQALICNGWQPSAWDIIAHEE